jgi:Spherulation-specific family 4
MMLFAVYLGFFDNPVPAAQAQTSSSKPIGYTDFFYVYPSQGAATPAYANLIALKRAYPQVPMVAIIDDGNGKAGAGGSADPNYASAINGMRAVGIVVIGYVYCVTTYGNTPGSRNLIGTDSVMGGYDFGRGLEQAIDAWHSYYTIDGIFFDNAVPGYPSGTNGLNNPAPGWPGHTLLQYYQQATAYAKNTYGYTFVMDNVAKAYPAMIDVADSLTLEVYPHGTPLPTTTTLSSWTTSNGGTSEDFNMQAWLQTTVPSVAYLSSIQGYVSFVSITDTNSFQPSASYQAALLANLNQLVTGPTTTTSSTTTAPTTTTSSTTSHSTTTDPKPIGYTDFLYVYPSQGAATPAYANLIALKTTYPQVPMVAIVNVASGAGSSANPLLASAINAMRAVGIVVIGYVYCFETGQMPGSRNLVGSDSVIGSYDQNRGLEQAIDAWHSYYTIDGIFFDNAVPGSPSSTNGLNNPAPGWPGHTLLQYYQQATAYAKSAHGYTFTMDSVWKVYPAMIGAADVLNIENYPHTAQMPSPSTLQSWTTVNGGTSADFSLIAWSQTTVPSVAYLSSIKGHVSFVSLTDTGGQPSTSYQATLVANLNQL